MLNLLEDFDVVSQFGNGRDITLRGREEQTCLVLVEWLLLRKDKDRIIKHNFNNDLKFDFLFAMSSLRVAYKRKQLVNQASTSSDKLYKLQLVGADSFNNGQIM